jgi:hypothetical protein
MIKKYIIIVEGCDDDTIIEKDLTIDEFNLIQYLIRVYSKEFPEGRMYIKELEK